MSFRYIALFYKKKVPALDTFLFFVQLPITSEKIYKCVIVKKHTFIHRRHSTTTPDDGPLGESEFCATSFSTSPTSPFGTFVGQSPPRVRRKSGESCKKCSNGSVEQNGE